MEFPPELLERLPENIRASAISVLEQDPRAGYDRGKDREFRLAYHGFDLVFKSVEDKLLVIDVVPIP